MEDNKNRKQELDMSIDTISKNKSLTGQAARKAVAKVATQPALPQTESLKSKLQRAGSKRGKLSTVARRSDLTGSDVGLDLTTFAGRLASLRLGAEMTQTDVGDYIERTRQMVARYESGQSYPDLDVLEKLAKRFGVSPTYLAFGEHAVKVPKPDMVVNVDEVTISKSGRRITGSYLLPKALVQTYVSNPRDLRVFVLDHNAALFGWQAGDRLFIDTSTDKLTIKHDLYAVEIGGELEVVQYVPSASKTKVTLLLPSNRTVQVDAKDIKVVGSIVSVLARRA